jgi:hypothetical protein
VKSSGFLLTKYGGVLMTDIVNELVAVASVSLTETVIT